MLATPTTSDSSDSAASPTLSQYSQLEAITFEKSFISPKAPEREFLFKPITEEYLYQCARLQSECFCRQNNLYIHFNVPTDLYYEKFALPLVRKVIKEQIGVMCIERGTNEVVAQILNEDFSTEDSDPFYLNRDELLDRRAAFHKVIRAENARIIRSFPLGRYETIHVDAVATSPKVQGLGLFTEMLKFQMAEHPIIKHAKVLFGEATHPNSGFGMIKSGWKTAWKREWKEFADIPGYEVFAELDRYEFSSRKEDGKNVAFNVFVREGVEL